MGEKFGGVDLILINTGAYDFEVITGKKISQFFIQIPKRHYKQQKI